MRTKKAEQFADDLDHMLFSASNRLQRLAEMTNDPALTDASKIVAAQRQRVRAHMDDDQREQTRG